MNRAISIVIVLFVLAAWPVWGDEAEAEYPPAVRAKCVRVIDGDTIECRVGRKLENVRLISVDSPERGQPGFEKARDFMVELCEGKRIRLEFDKRERDRWGRILGYVFLKGRRGDTFVNGELLKSGNAIYLGHFPTDRYNDLLVSEYKRPGDEE